MPKVSIITPTYNRAEIISSAVRSILDQTEKDWEYLVVDDGSTDDTEQVILEFNDPRIRYLKKQNAGPSSARNLGIKNANAKWIMYLDSDDLLHSNCVERMLHWLETTPNAVFGFPRAKRVKELYKNGKLVSSQDDSEDTPETFSIEDIFNRNAGFACNGFTHLRSVAEEGIRWDEDLNRMEDWELMLQLGNQHPNGFVYVPEVLYTYKQKYGSDNLVSQSTYKTWADAFEYIYQKHKDEPFMKNQTWYPRKVEKWRKLQAEYDRGERRGYEHYYFDREKEGS